MEELAWPLSAPKKVFVRETDVLGLPRENVTFCLRNENVEETTWLFLQLQINQIF